MNIAAKPHPEILNGFAEQDENGIDLSHLRANLRLTPTERLERHRGRISYGWRYTVPEPLPDFAAIFDRA